MKTKIMIVEDEGITASYIQRTLEKLGYLVTSIANSGQEAIDSMAADTPDLILMDIKIYGKMDGIETAAQIKKRFSVPVVYLTAHSDTDMIERAKVTEPFGFVIKPFDSKDLHSNIEMALYKHHTDTMVKKQQERFISFLVHDLRNPLIAIAGLSKRALDGKAADPGKMLDLFHHIHSASTLMLTGIETLAKAIKDRSALASFTMEEVRLDEIVHSVIQSHAPSFEKAGVTCVLNNTGQEQARERISVKGDKYHLTTLVENLLGNAVKYAKSKVTVELCHNTDQVSFAVCDDGPGISGEHREKIFEEYYQIPGSKQGTGLGLSSVKKVIDAHQGAITIADSEEGGAKFIVVLPVNR